MQADSVTETCTNGKFVYSAVNNNEADFKQPNLETKKIEQSYRNEYIAAFGVALGTLLAGITFTWPATSIPLLLQPDSPVHLESHHFPVIVTSLQVGVVPGALFGSVFADYIGRKKIILCVSIPFFIANVIYAYSSNVYYIYIGRFLAGLGVGSGFTVIPVYISEIASPAIRGKLSAAVMGMASAIGILYMYILSPYVSVRRNSLICAFIPVCMFGLVYMNPESPYFLVMKNRENEAREALIRLRNRDNVEEELIRIRQGAKEQQATKSSPIELVKGSNLKALGMIGYTYFLQQFSGVTIYVSYSQLLFMTTHTKLPIDFCGMLIPVISIGVLFLSGKLCDKLGRVQLLKISCFGTAFINILLSSFFFLQEKGSSYAESLSIIPVVGIIFFKSIYFFGLGCIPYLAMVELMPTNVRAWSTCFFTITMALLSVASVFCYETLKNLFGMSSSFLAFAFCSFIGAILVKYVLLETKGQTLEQIQENLKKTKQQGTILKV